MAKFVYIYYAGSSTDGGSAEEWGKWFGVLGDKLVDPGNPFDGGGQAVSAEGVMDVREPAATGYSIVNAASKAEAVEMAKACPLMTAKNGAVCVFEALPM